MRPYPLLVHTISKRVHEAFPELGFYHMRARDFKTCARDGLAHRDAGAQHRPKGQGPRDKIEVRVGLWHKFA